VALSDASNRAFGLEFRHRALQITNSRPGQLSEPRHPLPYVPADQRTELLSERGDLGRGPPAALGRAVATRLVSTAAWPA
jgi:hypothetical protein